MVQFSLGSRAELDFGFSIVAKGIAMRKLWVGLALFAMPVQAFAQGGMGGMGGMDNGSMGGGMGGPGGGMGRPGGGGPDGPPGGGRPRQMKPLKRDRLDKPVQEMFRSADSNGDGIVTLEELRTVLEARRDGIIRARFARIDANGDRLIQPDEFVTWQKSLGSAAVADRREDSGPVAESIAPEYDDGDRMLEMLIEPLSATVIVNANSNYDKGITLEELLTYERKRFGEADADKNGELSPEEMRSLIPEQKDGPPMDGRGGGGAPRDGAGGPPPR